MKKTISLFLLFIIPNLFAIEVIKPFFPKKNIILRINKIHRGDFGSFKLVNWNLQEMELVCKDNPFYRNQNAYIEYRNIYGERADEFSIEENSVCEDLVQFFDRALTTVDDEHPFIIHLNLTSRKVIKIQYPIINIYSDRLESSQPKDPVKPNQPIEIKKY